MGAKLLRNGTVISWDDENQVIKVLEGASVLLADDTISGIAERVEELFVPEDAEVIDVTGMILTPGFVNAHTHMWQTAFRSLAPDIFIAQYFGWLSQMGTATRSFSASDVYTSCLQGYYEGLNAGITSYVEHASNNWTNEVVRPGWEAARDSAARVWWCHDVLPGNVEQADILAAIKTEADSPGNLTSMVCTTILPVIEISPLM